LSNSDFLSPLGQTSDPLLLAGSLACEGNLNISAVPLSMTISSIITVGKTLYINDSITIDMENSSETDTPRRKIMDVAVVFGTFNEVHITGSPNAQCIDPKIEIVDSFGVYFSTQDKCSSFNYIIEIVAGSIFGAIVIVGLSVAVIFYKKKQARINYKFSTLFNSKKKPRNNLNKKHGTN